MTTVFLCSGSGTLCSRQTSRCSPEINQLDSLYRRPTYIRCVAHYCIGSLTRSLRELKWHRCYRSAYWDPNVGDPLLLNRYITRLLGVLRHSYPALRQDAHPTHHKARAARNLHHPQKQDQQTILRTDNFQARWITWLSTRPRLEEICAFQRHSVLPPSSAPPSRGLRCERPSVPCRCRRRLGGRSDAVPTGTRGRDRYAV